ncbi:hypothetical protein MKW94_015186, partial [Papaver nudicaule]|nr:hypothetical protein [Papaver nudicaule]
MHKIIMLVLSVVLQLSMFSIRITFGTMHGSRETDRIIWVPQQKSMIPEHKFGFIVMGASGILFGRLSGNTRKIIYRFTVDLPKKHGRGGQSALLRTEKCNDYVRDTAAFASYLYIDPDTCQPNVSGLILAGSDDFKTGLSPGMFEPLLQAKLLKVVVVSCGGENGFDQAIKLTSKIVVDAKLSHET